MVGNPNILIWVQEVGFSERRDAFVVHGHDFRHDFGWRGGDSPTRIFSFKGRQCLVLPGMEIAHVHRSGKSWAWETRTPERFPEPPCLLTDDPQCGFAFEGRVRTTPTARAADEIVTLFDEFGACSVPLFGCGWFGVLAVEPGDHEAGHLVAFSRAAMQVAGVYEMQWAGEDEAFGRVDVPWAERTSDCPRYYFI